LQRFCNAPHATSSSHEQTIFRPPLHFSTLISQRGNMHQLPAAGIAPAIGCGATPVVMPGFDIPRSNIIIALDILAHSFVANSLAFARAKKQEFPFAASNLAG
jgi:hypothetical protein